MIDIYKDLEKTGLDVWQQGAVPEDMPESYITVWNDSSSDNINADNRTKSIVYQFTVIYYTTDERTIYTKFEEIASLLKEKNYIYSGMGFDIESGVENYSARCIEVSKIERRN